MYLYVCSMYCMYVWAMLSVNIFDVLSQAKEKAAAKAAAEKEAAAKAAANPP